MVIVNPIQPPTEFMSLQQWNFHFWSKAFTKNLNSWLNNAPVKRNKQPAEDTAPLEKKKDKRLEVTGTSNKGTVVVCCADLQLWETNWWQRFSLQKTSCSGHLMFCGWCTGNLFGQTSSGSSSMVVGKWVWIYLESESTKHSWLLRGGWNVVPHCKYKDEDRRNVVQGKKKKGSKSEKLTRQ